MEFWKLNLKEIGILKIWVLKIRFKNWNFGKLVENRNFGQLSGNGIFIKIKFLTLKKWRIKRIKHLAHWGLPQANKGSEQ